MFTISNAPSAVILGVTVLFLVVLSWFVDPDTKPARWVQNILWFSAINVGAVCGMYAFWAWTPVNVAIEFRQWAKLVDGLAAFGVAGAMIGLQRSLKR
jgi:hypothetical protein